MSMNMSDILGFVTSLSQSLLLTFVPFAKKAEHPGYYTNIRDVSPNLDDEVHNLLSVENNI